MADTLKCITPVDGSVYVERPLASVAEARKALNAAREAQAAWKHTPLAERQAYLTKALEAFLAKGQEIAAEITWQMGRPISQSPGELRGFDYHTGLMFQGFLSGSGRAVCAGGRYDDLMGRYGFPA